jgi:2-hydroxy-3-keto-5-methylthiopentenyl-1-phosphate phosphatase
MSNKELLKNFIKWLREQDSFYILSASDEIIKKFLNEINEK